MIRPGTTPTPDAGDEISESAQSLWETTLAAAPRFWVALVVITAGWLVLAAVELLAVAVTFPSVKPVDVLAGLGVFSLAIGFAFQDILENTLSGILLLFRQPFRSGDQIEVMDRTGTVIEINIRETRMTTRRCSGVVFPARWSRSTRR